MTGGATTPMMSRRASTSREASTWTTCPACGQLVYRPRLERRWGVCPECGHHTRLSVPERIRQLVEDDSFVPSEPQYAATDPLRFTDARTYADRLAAARCATGLPDAALYGRARIDGMPVVVLGLDFGFLGGSMGTAVGESVAAAAEEATAGGSPLVLVVASGGARMQEGCLSLMQMAKTALAVRDLGAYGIPSVCVLTDPTFGGVTASFATLADVLIAEQGSLIGFAGPRVIRAATAERLPDGFQTAEYLHARGLVDAVEPRDRLGERIARTLRLFPGPRSAASRGDAADPPGSAGSVGSAAVDPVRRDAAAVPPDRTPYRTVQTARDVRRPTTLDYLARICDDFVELRGDRQCGDDPAIVGGIGSLRGVATVLLGHQKGHDTAEQVARNFGMPHPEGFRKALRLLRLAERHGMPVVTFVDTQGAAPGIGAEERGQAWAIAESIAGFGQARVPICSVVIGEGGSGGALALAVADEVLMLEHACYSVISPESCSTILFGDPSRADTLAESLRITAPELLRLGVVDGVVPEPEGGAQEDWAGAADAVGGAVSAALARIRAVDAESVGKRRRDRFRALGVAGRV